MAERTWCLRVAIHQEADHLWGEVLTMPGCFATGRTLAELLEALAEAIEMCDAQLEGAPADG